MVDIVQCCSSAYRCGSGVCVCQSGSRSNSSHQQFWLPKPPTPHDVQPPRAFSPIHLAPIPPPLKLTVNDARYANLAAHAPPVDLEPSTVATVYLHNIWFIHGDGVCLWRITVTPYHHHHQQPSTIIRRRCVWHMFFSKVTRAAWIPLLVSGRMPVRIIPRAMSIAIFLSYCDVAL